MLTHDGKLQRMCILSKWFKLLFSDAIVFAALLLLFVQLWQFLLEIIKKGKHCVKYSNWEFIQNVLANGQIKRFIRLTKFRDVSRQTHTHRHYIHAFAVRCAHQNDHFDKNCNKKFIKPKAKMEKFSSKQLNAVWTTSTIFKNPISFYLIWSVIMNRYHRIDKLSTWVFKEVKLDFFHRFIVFHYRNFINTTEHTSIVI